MRAPHHATAILRSALTVLVALFVALRVVAQPLVLAAPEPGLMALCTGGKIVYVSIETGELVEKDGAGDVVIDPCPFFGVTAFDHSAKETEPRPASLLTTIAPSLMQTQVKPISLTGQNAARAPPVST